MSQVLSGLSIVVVLLAGVLAFWHGTDGGIAWTAESARKVNVRANPISIPRLAISDTKSRNLDINGANQILLLDFIFTRCPTICTALGSEFQWLQRHFEQAEDGQEIKLVSLSFDFLNDSSDDLNRYLSRYSAIQERWRAGLFDNEKDLETLMQIMGVVAIPDDQFGFIHNAAIYLIVNGELVEIFALGERQKILESIERHSS